MPEMEEINLTHSPPPATEPLLMTPIAILTPPITYAPHAPEFSSVHEEYLAEQEGLRRMAEKVSEAE